LLGVVCITDGVGASRAAASCEVPGKVKRGTGSGDAGEGVVDEGVGRETSTASRR
jgi:hypothetical protein